MRNAVGVVLWLAYLCVWVTGNAMDELIGQEQSSGSEDCGCAGAARGNGVTLSSIEGAGSGSPDSVSEQFVTTRALQHDGNNVQGVSEDMVFLTGGDSFIGTDNPQIVADGEAPLRLVTLSPYLLDRFAVTNADFAQFIASTQFVTENEKFGWSFVFHTAIPQHLRDQITQAVQGAEWWLPLNGTTWRHPEGIGSDVFASNRSMHPVVQVTWNDAVAYCAWRQARLPTEAEWEHAARGPVTHIESPSRFPWGDALVPPEGHRMNVFQGRFPVENTKKDGYEFTCPVDAFGPQNEFGFFNMIGNVWEWVHDWHTIRHDRKPRVNPTGPVTGRERVKKGGSFLCHRSYCYRYRTVARFPSTPDSAASNVGFRCARSATEEDILRQHRSQEGIDDREL